MRKEQIRGKQKQTVKSPEASKTKKTPEQWQVNAARVLTGLGSTATGVYLGLGTPGLPTQSFAGAQTPPSGALTRDVGASGIQRGGFNYTNVLNTAVETTTDQRTNGGGELQTIGMNQNTLGILRAINRRDTTGEAALKQFMELRETLFQTLAGITYNPVLRGNTELLNSYEAILKEMETAARDLGQLDPIMQDNIRIFRYDLNQLRGLNLAPVSDQTLNNSQNLNDRLGWAGKPDESQ